MTGTSGSCSFIANCRYATHHQAEVTVPTNRCVRSAALRHSRPQDCTEHSCGLTKMGNPFCFSTGLSPTRFVALVCCEICGSTAYQALRPAHPYRCWWVAADRSALSRYRSSSAPVSEVSACQARLRTPCSRESLVNSVSRSAGAFPSISNWSRNSTISGLVGLLSPGRLVTLRRTIPGVDSDCIS